MMTNEALIIKLTPKQQEYLRPLFDKVEIDLERNKTAVSGILAQMYGIGYMRVMYIGPEKAKQVVKITFDEQESQS